MHSNPPHYEQFRTPDDDDTGEWPVIDPYILDRDEEDEEEEFHPLQGAAAFVLASILIGCVIYIVIAAGHWFGGNVADWTK